MVGYYVLKSDIKYLWSTVEQKKDIKYLWLVNT